ncbi:MAG: permease-like cell division protein FtsX [Eubacteriales bacterium]|nr:permease-like cell division protein FtsX [Eubacteriales bacterium]
MKISTLGYSIKQGLKNIRRNLLFSLASVGTIIACLFLFGVFYSIVLNMRTEILAIESSLTISVFFEEGTSENQIQNIGNEIQKISNVDTMQYISADAAWNLYIDDVYKGDKEYVDSVFGDDNPLSNSSSYEITLNDIGKQAETVETIKAISGVRQVNSSDGTAKSLSAISRLVSYASLGVIGVLLLVSLFLISNTITIGISVRKEEIAIMKLIGAKDFFVRAPFLVEGVMIGLVGAVVPSAIIYLLYNTMTNYLVEHFSIVANMVEFVPVQEVFHGMLPISLLIGVGVGFFGSLLTTHKHLRV